MSTMASARSDAIETAAFAAAGALVLALSAAAFPMTMTPDSGDYLAAGREILEVARDDALSFWGLGTRFRILGYPALLAVLEGLFGAHLEPALHLVQAALVLLSATVLFALLRRLGVTPLWAALLAMLYLTTWPRHLAGFMLTDAIHNAVTAIAVCLLVEPLFREMRISWARIVAASLLIAVAFLLRESNQYAIVCFLPILAVLAWKLARQQRRVAAALLLIPVFAVPTLAAVEAYKAFNQVRFGERFVTTAARTAMLQPLMPVAKRHPELFDGDTPYDAKARETFEAYTFTEILDFNTYWLKQNAVEQRGAEWAFAKYYEAWRRYPLDMVAGILTRLRIDKQATELLNPPGTLYTTARWHEPGLPSEKQRLVAAWQAGDIAGMLAILPLLAGRVLSLLVYVLFLVGTPLAVVMALRRGEAGFALALLALLATFVGYCLVFALVHLTMRYLGGIAVILPIALSLAVLAIRRYRAAGRSEGMIDAGPA